MRQPLTAQQRALLPSSVIPSYGEQVQFKSPKFMRCKGYRLSLSPDDVLRLGAPAFRPCYTESFEHFNALKQKGHKFVPLFLHLADRGDCIQATKADGRGRALFFRDHGVTLLPIFAVERDERGKLKPATKHFLARMLFEGIRSEAGDETVLPGEGSIRL